MKTSPDAECSGSPPTPTSSYRALTSLNFRGGKPFHVLELARERKINLTVSDAILDEIADVLARKFDFTPEDIA